MSPKPKPRPVTEEKPEEPKEEPARAGPQPEPKKRPVRAIVASVVGVGVLGIATWYALHRGLESTDDAQVETDVVAVPSRVGGVITEVSFHENQAVKAGDVLVQIDPAPLTARLQQSEAELASAKAAADAADAEAQVIEASARGQKQAAQAALQGASVGSISTQDQILQAEAALSAAQTARTQAQTDLERTKKLFESGAIAKAMLDNAQSAFDAADANLSQAKARLALARSETASSAARIEEAKARVGQTSAVEAQIAQARARASNAHARVDVATAARDLASLDLSYTKIKAPRDGRLSKKSVTVGQMLAPGQPIAMLVSNDTPWIVANFKETQLEKMHEGQPVTAVIDAYSGLELHGHVESMSGATGARFSLLPPDNATGNFTKVVQRVPVKIVLDAPPNDHPLRPGMSAEVTVDTRK